VPPSRRQRTAEINRSVGANGFDKVQRPAVVSIGALANVLTSLAPDRPDLTAMLIQLGCHLIRHFFDAISGGAQRASGLNGSPPQC
jgi:hypothetical protein